MAIDPNVLRKIASLELPAEKLAAVLDIIADVQEAADRAEAAIAEKKKRDRERKRSKENPRNIHGSSEENPRKVGGTSAEIPMEKPLPPMPPQDKVSPTPPSKLNPPYIPPSPSGDRQARERAIEARMREIMITEPIVVAVDFHHVARLLDDPNITEADCLEACRAAMADETFRPKSWRQMVGWVRGAAKDRIAGNSKQNQKVVISVTTANPNRPIPISQPQFVGDSVIDIVDPGKVAASILGPKVREYYRSGVWPEVGFGRPPGTMGCRIPPSFLAWCGGPPIEEEVEVA